MITPAPEVKPSLETPPAPLREAEELLVGVTRGGSWPGQVGRADVISIAFSYLKTYSSPGVTFGVSRDEAKAAQLLYRCGGFGKEMEIRINWK